MDTNILIYKLFDSNLIQWLYDWQTLIGTILGAFITALTPLLIYIFFDLRKKKKDHLYDLVKTVVYNLNGVIDLKKTVDIFLKKQLARVIEDIKSYENNYCVNFAFFPKSSDIKDIDIISLRTGSSYLDNKLVQVSKMTKEFNFGLSDFMEQFRHTVEFHRFIAFNKLNPPTQANGMYKDNLEEFVKTVDEQLLGKNIPIFIEQILYARFALEEIRKTFGIIRWKLRFEPHFKFFKNKKTVNNYKKDTFTRIEDFLKPKVEKEKTTIREILEND